MCHQRGSVVAEVVLKKVDMPGGDGDCRGSALLAKELVDMINDEASCLRSSELGKLATSATIDGPIAVPVCDLVAKALRARGADWHQQLQESSGILSAKVESVAARHLDQCKRVIFRMLHSQLAATFDSYFSRVQEVKLRRENGKRVLCRMLHTHLAAAFDGFCAAVEQLTNHRQLVLRAVSRWQTPMLQIGFEMWCEFMAATKALQQEQSHEQAKQMLQSALDAEVYAIKHQKSLVENECQRRMDMCRKTVQRMFHIQLATAFDSFRDRILQVRAKKVTAKRIIQRMLHTQLAGCF